MYTPPAFRDDVRHQSLFMELMRCGGNVPRVLKRMARYGILGKYLPAFGRAVGLMQHDLFHVYTVDAHTLRLLKVAQEFLDLANDDGVENVGHRFRVCAEGGSATQHHGTPLITLVRQRRDLGTMQNGDQVEVVQFVGYGRRHHGKVLERA